MLLTAHGAHGQSAAFATFTGRALDPQGASVSGATVTATNVETGIVRTTQTTSDGLYRFDDLPPGVYDIVIEAPSFTKDEAKNVKLRSASSATSTSSLRLPGRRCPWS
jgi:protocatechuate 3,4-dioxygenase beta subunit